jgi:hypothetical protein
LFLRRDNFEDWNPKGMSKGDSDKEVDILAVATLNHRQVVLRDASFDR